MTGKWSWLLSVAALAGAALLLGRWTARVPAASAQGSDGQQELVERVKRLELGIPRLERSMAQTGASVGRAALAGAAAEPGSGDHAAPGAAPAESAAEHTAREVAHYDRLDSMVRAGGGATLATRLRKNIAEPDPRLAGTKVDVAALDCNDELCRVEVRLKGPVDTATISTARVLMAGMGNLSMRPHDPKGGPSIYYVAAPGHRLPRLDP
jgi:hypothetical protein